MPIISNSLLQSSVANDTFMDRQIDTNTIGRIDLLNTELESGPSVTNVQEKLNENRLIMNATVVLQASDSLAIDSIGKNQYFRVAGDSGAVTLTTPLLGTAKDGTVIYIVGTDDTNTVTITSDDSAGGTYINGNATLLRGYMLKLIYDATLDRYLEIGRNF